MNQTREAFRAEGKVRLVTTQEEGARFEKLPAGVYGFTYAPATETPLLAKCAYGAYEIHKLAAGLGWRIVYVTREQPAVLVNGPGLGGTGFVSGGIE